MKKYQTLNLNINSKGNLDLNLLSVYERDILKSRDIIYLYIGVKDIYIGQTIHLLDRHIQHKKECDFQMSRYNMLIVIYGVLVDKHLDYIEKSIINLMIVDNSKKFGMKRNIRNKTLGNNSNYTQIEKDIDNHVIYPFWTEELSSFGVINSKDVSELKNSILFKYSPFHHLTMQQNKIIDTILTSEGNYIIEGGAGTGKTVLMTNLVARIYQKYGNNKKVAVIVKTNWSNSGKIIFKSYGIKNVTVGTWGQIVNKMEKYDYVLVDEAHRLPYKHGYQMAYDLKIFKNRNENYSLNLIGKIAKSLILFYDTMQSIRPADIPVEFFKEYLSKNHFQRFLLNTQFRIVVKDKNNNYTSSDYLKGIKYALQLSEDNSFDKKVFSNEDKDSYFGMVGSIEELFKYIERMDNVIIDSQNRVIAGYSREWISKKDKSKFDWEEGSKKWHWNSSSEDWMNTENSRNEIGSIHAIQGIDINCVGLIIGKDLTYANSKVIANRDEYFDKFGKPKKHKNEIADLDELVKNIYYVLATRGIDGIRIYVEDFALRKHIMNVLGIKELRKY